MSPVHSTGGSPPDLFCTSPPSGGPSRLSPARSVLRCGPLIDILPSRLLTAVSLLEECCEVLRGVEYAENLDAALDREVEDEVLLEAADAEHAEPGVLGAARVSRRAQLRHSRELPEGLVGRREEAF